MPCICVGQQSRKTSECQLMAAASLQLMDLTSLRAVLWDLRRQLIPSRFEKAQQPDAARLQLGFRSLSGMTWVELSWLAEAPHLIQILLRRDRELAARWPSSCSTACASWPSWSFTSQDLSGLWNSVWRHALGAGSGCWCSS